MTFIKIYVILSVLEKDRHRYLKEIFFEIVIFVMFYFILFYMLGLVIGIARTPNYYTLHGFKTFIIPTIIYAIVREILRYNIGSKLFIQNVIGNILLFIPFGMFLNYYFKVRIISLIIITILYSLSIELTQTLIDRVFDIDDIILNLVGSIIGYYFSKYAS